MNGTHSGKVSKRLKFVRRSLYDTRDAPTDTPLFPSPGIIDTNYTTSSTRKVEVFKSRREAEQRILTCFAVKHNNMTEPVSPVRPAMQRTVWGSNNKITKDTLSATTTSSSDNSSIIVNNISMVDTTTIQPVSANATVPANTYYTALIDSAKLDLFLRTVPHYYPDAATIANISAKNRNIQEEEDPLWASYKRKHHKVSQVNKHDNTPRHGSNGAHYVNDKNQTTKGEYFDTSMSNKPVRLSQHKSNIDPMASVTPSTNDEVNCYKYALHIHVCLIMR